MDSATPAIIELNKVTTSSGPFPILSGLTLNVRSGQFINLYGPTGCGKTTVLRVISGQMKIERGTVRVAGRDLSQMSSSAIRKLRQHIGFMYPKLLPPEQESLSQGVMLPAILAGYSYREAWRLASEALSLCGLSPLESNRVSELSSGQRQLARLAAALVHQPILILADEPTAYLDPNHSVQVLNVLSSYARQGGTVLAVSNKPIPAPYATAIDMENLRHE